MPRLAMPQDRGRSMTLVASSRPPSRPRGCRRRPACGRRREARGGCDLEKARLDARAGVEHFGQQRGELRRPRSAGRRSRIRSLKRTRCGLVKTWTLWPAASSPARRKAHGRAFAVGPGDMEHRRKPVLRPAEPVEQRGDALEPEPVAGGRKLGESVELGLDLRVRRPREIGHQAAAFASGAR